MASQKPGRREADDDHLTDLARELLTRCLERKCLASISPAER
jgi:hypothetical protein